MRALIISVDLGSPDYQAHAQEFEMLATGAGAVLVGTLKARRQRPDAAYFIGSGKVQEGVLLAEQGDAEVVLFDQPLSPAQQRNLERQFNLRVVGPTSSVSAVASECAVQASLSSRWIVG